jgi:AcrR family transcriptional regulator
MVDTRELLIEKGTALFYKKGFGSSSVRDIVKSAGVTNSALYNHFRNKDHLLYVIIERIGDKYIDIINDIQSKYDHPLDRLREMIIQTTCLVKERKQEIKVFLDDEYHLSPKFKGKTRGRQRIFYDFCKKQLSDLEKMGLLRPVNKTVASFSCFAMINSSYRWFKKEGNLSVEEIAENIIDIFFEGILKR